MPAGEPSPAGVLMQLTLQPLAPEPESTSAWLRRPSPASSASKSTLRTYSTAVPSFSMRPPCGARTAGAASPACSPYRETVTAGSLWHELADAAPVARGRTGPATVTPERDRHPRPAPPQPAAHRRA